MYLPKFMLTMSILTLTACATGSTLTPNGAQVKFVKTKPDGSCKLIGSAEGRRSAFFSGNKTRADLINDAVRDLQNNAAAMGGNIIFNVRDSRQGVISKLMPTDAIVQGDVYQCLNDAK